MKDMAETKGAGMPLWPPNLAWAHLPAEAVLHDRGPRKKEVACQMVQSKMRNNGQSEDQLPCTMEAV